MSKRQPKSLADRLEQVRQDMMWACECDGRGCTLCNGAGVVMEAIVALSCPVSPSPQEK